MRRAEAGTGPLPEAASPVGKSPARRFWILAWATAGLLTVLAYVPGLQGILIYDDAPVLGPYLGRRRLLHPFWSSSGPLGRPVSMWTFWLDRLLWPGSLLALNLTNLGLHLIAGTLAGLLARRLFRLAGASRRGAALAGFWIGAFFLAEPLQVATVLYTVQRMAILSALFSLAALWCYCEARCRNLENQPALPALLAGLILFPLLAVFSKENGALSPVLALVAELLFFRFRGSRAIRRLLGGYYGILTALALGLCAWALLDRSFLIDGYRGRRFTFPERLLTESRVLIRYLVMPFWPSPARVSFFHDDIRLSTGLGHPPTTTLALLLLAVLVAMAMACRKKRPLLTFGIAWFLIGQFLESTFIPLDLMFVHRNYLPLFGLLLAAADLLWLAGTAIRKRLVPGWRPAILGLAPLPVWSLFLVLAFQQAGLWSSPLRFYRSGVREHPRSAIAVSGLAATDAARGETHRAIRLLDHSGIVGAGLQADVYRCQILHRLPAGQPGARLIPAHAIHLSTYPINALTRLAILGLTGRCRYPASRIQILFAQAAHARRMRDHNWFLVWIYSGYENERSGRLGPALGDLRRAAQARSTTPVPWLLGARWLLAHDRRRQARIWLSRARAELGSAPSLEPVFESLVHTLYTPAPPGRSVQATGESRARTQASSSEANRAQLRSPAKRHAAWPRFRGSSASRRQMARPIAG